MTFHIDVDAVVLQKALTLDHKDRDLWNRWVTDASSFFFSWQVRTIFLAVELRVAPAFEAAQDLPLQNSRERCQIVVPFEEQAALTLHSPIRESKFSSCGWMRNTDVKWAFRKWPSCNTTFAGLNKLAFALGGSHAGKRNVATFTAEAASFSGCTVLSGLLQRLPECLGIHCGCHNSYVSGRSGNKRLYELLRIWLSLSMYRL